MDVLLLVEPNLVYWKLSIVGGRFDAHNFDGAGFTSVFKTWVVTLLTNLFYHLFIFILMSRKTVKSKVVNMRSHEYCPTKPKVP
jgi:hypothetical protein